MRATTGLPHLLVFCSGTTVVQYLKTMVPTFCPASHSFVTTLAIPHDKNYFPAHRVFKKLTLNLGAVSRDSRS